MRRTALLSLAVVSALLIAPWTQAEDRPRYGGTLRVQVRDPVVSLDPGDGKDLTPTRTRIAHLLFDRLTQIDDQERVRPQLAVSWTSDAQRKQWRFTLRPGVVFHDGTSLTAAHVIATFANDSRWQVRSGNGPQVVVFECPNPVYDLPAIVAGARHSIVQRSTEGVQGTGPFRVRAWLVGRQLSLAPNLDHFDGRPYLDAIELQMGNSLREQLIDQRLDRDDLVEVDLDQARRLEAASQRVSMSSPGRLLAIVFRPDHNNAALRELIARSLDRDAIHAGILRKSGAPASSLLPQWLTGYALLFADSRDAQRIQKLRSDLVRTPPLFLAYDPSDPLNKAVADRIAVNARDVGLTIQVFAEKNASITAAGQSTRADAVLTSLPIGSANSAQALSQIAEVAQMNPGDALSSATPEQLHAAEIALLEGYKVIPVAHLPSVVWVSSRVRNWKISPEGRWKLEQVWLDSVQ